jgi:catechol 2,3-dioxygenase-like lactoylglutathione lyase family enzyme
MKRFHVHVAVKDLDQSARFYSAMFGVEPTVLKPDYAKWQLDDPRVNFAISQRNQAPGVNHLGVQAETDEELEGIHANLQRADASVLAEKGISCCYAKSDKYWVTDPQGLAWESFRSLGSVPLYGEENHTASGASADDAPRCCAPMAEPKSPATATACCARAD